MAVKRSHTVSKGYLRAWADARGRVDVMDLQQGRGFESSIENATVVSHAYEPEVLIRDLEGEYARVEDRGIRALLKLRETRVANSDERSAVVAFLDMHLDRGRYADQIAVRTPAILVKTEGRIEHAELGVGDRLLLSRSIADVVRVGALGVSEWRWQVRDAQNLATGDGAVLLWRATDGAEVSTVSYPLSPTRILVMGEDLPDDTRLNTLLAMKSRRWIVGLRGTLDFSRAASIAALRAVQRAGARPQN